MVTIYSVDGDGIALLHCCPTNNQPRNGSSKCWGRWVTTCGLGRRRRFGPGRCGSRRPIPQGGTEHLLDLLLTDRFPRIWVPSREERDLRQLLKHRQKLVRMRTSVKNQLHYLAMSQGGVCRKRKLWTTRGRQELERLQLGQWASRRRKELLEWLDRLEPEIAELDQAVEQEGQSRAEVVELRKQHKGVGPVVGLAFVLTLGPVERFQHSRQVVSYLGLNPREDSSGGHQRLGHITKQGNEMMRWLLVEAGQSAVQYDPELRRKYQRFKFRRGAKVDKVAIARQLAVRMYWTLRQMKAATSPVRMSGSPAQTLVPQAGSSF